jgi:outer membrane receptor protein involved in Fe transport
MKRAIRQLTLPAALAVLALLVPAQVASASPLAVQQDCADSDVLERKHSRADLQKTLKNIQGDVDEYTDCEKMVLAALAGMKKGKASGNGGAGGAGAIDPDLNGDGVVTPREKRIAAKKAKERRERRNRQIAAVSDDLVQDDAAVATGDGGGSGGSSLPLILGLVALVCAGAGGGLWYASKRNPGVANALSRVPLPFRNS